MKHTPELNMIIGLTYELLIHLQLFTHMILTFYIYIIPYILDPDQFFRKFKSGSKKCSRTPDPLWIRIRAYL